MTITLGALALMMACDSPAQVEEVAPRRPTQPSTAARVAEGGSTVAPAGLGPGSSPGARMSPYVRAVSGRFYVPIYSHIYVDEGEAEDLAVTLSIRNISTENPLVLNMVSYYDTSGKLIEDYLGADVVIGPLETIEYFVRVTDRRGGSGANFIVSWRGDSPMVKPLIEAIMVRTRTGNQAYAFTTRGIEIPDSAALPDNHPPPGSYPDSGGATGHEPEVWQPETPPSEAAPEGKPAEDGAAAPGSP